MNRQQKENLVAFLRQEFTDAQASFLVDYKGLTVDKLHALRKELRKKNGTLKVTKARLMKRALNGIEGVDALSDYLHGQIGMIFASSDVAGTAKALHIFAQENDKLKLLAGFVDAHVLNAQNVVRIASLPSKEIMLAQLCGTMKAPLNNFVGILNMLIVRLLSVLKQKAEKQAAH